MVKNIKILISALLIAIIVSAGFIPCYAEETTTFDSNAYATIITLSDVQGKGDAAFNNFSNILTKMKNDGLNTPDSILIGGDFSKALPNYATPGVEKVRSIYSEIFPDADAKKLVAIQGNHDAVSSEFTKTGLYDMGSYLLYAINEDDFQWNQYLRSDSKVKETADNVKTALNKLIKDGEHRPVFIITHVPLHKTDRTSGGDNMYSSYLFNVINEAATKLDIVFLFGHNHSGDYDDYIGGTINFLAPGDTIKIPDPANKKNSTDEKLNFTYTNCGYVGYSGNSTENGSTDVLTVTAIEISEGKIRFVKYSENGLERVNETERMYKESTVKEITTYPEKQGKDAGIYENTFIIFLLKIYQTVLSLFL